MFILVLLGIKYLILALVVGSQFAHATTVTIVFNTGAGLLSPPTWPGTGTISPNGSTSGVNLGSSLRIADPSQPMLAAAIITGSVNGTTSNLFCQVSQTAGLCAGDATSDASNAAGHASGLGIGDARINDTDVLTITANAGYVVKLISFQVTAMIGSGTGQETGYYNLGSGNVNFLGGTLPIDSYTVNSGAFATLRFGAPTGGPNGGNTYSLQSITLDITTAAPEPPTLLLTGFGLLALGWSGRRLRQKPPGPQRL